MSKHGKALLVLVLLDAFLTAWLLHANHVYEMNPLLRWPYEAGGVPLFLACKLVFQMALVAALEILHARENHPRLYQFAVTMYGGMLVVLTALVNLN